MVFPNQHQEYGMLSLEAYDAGRTTAEPSLLDFAAAQGQTPTMFMLPVPSWGHPAWLVCAGLLSLVVAREVVALRWTATVVAVGYLGYRGVMWLGLVADRRGAGRRAGARRRLTRRTGAEGRCGRADDVASGVAASRGRSPRR